MQGMTGQVSERGRIGMETRERYQMRKAAGLYWLLDMQQEGAHGAGAIPFNETGAFIWEQYRNLESEAAVAERVSAEFGITREEGLRDVQQFLGQLRKQGIRI